MSVTTESNRWAVVIVPPAIVASWEQQGHADLPGVLREKLGLPAGIRVVGTSTERDIYGGRPVAGGAVWAKLNGHSLPLDCVCLEGDAIPRWDLADLLARLTTPPRRAMVGVTDALLRELLCLPPDVRIIAIGRGAAPDSFDFTLQGDGLPASCDGYRDVNITPRITPTIASLDGRPIFAGWGDPEV